MKEINIIIPTYNEKENILSLIKSIKKFIPKATIIIVDDTPKNDIGILINKNKISTDEIMKLTNLTENHSINELINNCLAKNSKKT